MFLFKKFYLFVLFIFLVTAVARASEERDLIIRKTMDCAQEHLHQNSAISWDEVCYTSAPPDDEHMQAVNQQMDRVEGVAKPQTTIEDDQSQPKKAKIEFSLAPETSYIKYRESVNTATFMKQSGMMSGINAIYTLHVPPEDLLYSDVINMYRLEGRFSYGKINYDGSNIFHGISDYMYELRFLLGKDFYFQNDSLRLTPYMGAGYRSLFDSFYANKPGGYNRWIQYAYVPTGAEVLARLNDGWSIGADAEYDIFVYGEVKSYLGEIGLGDLTNTQKNGYGLRASLKLIKKWGRFNFIIEPFIRYWHVHNSNIAQSTVFYFDGSPYVIVGEEPSNTSTEVGGKLAVEF